MTQKEKIEMLKETIVYLFEKEGRSKSYIAKLLQVDRKQLIQFINDLGLVQATIRHLTPSKEKFLNRHRKEFIDMLNSDVTLENIATKLGMSFKTLLDTYIKNDKELYHHYRFRQQRLANKRQESLECKKQKSSRNYDYDNIDGELWKDVLGYPDYQVSNMGRVRKYVKKYDNYMLLKVHPNVLTGRHYVTMYNGGKRQNLSVPRLVAFSFVSGHSDENCTVNHIDGDVSNNKASNLEWTSQAENNKKAYDLGRTKVVAHSKNGKFKEIVLDDKYSFKTIRALAKFLGVSETQAHRYISGETPTEHKIILSY